MDALSISEKIKFVEVVSKKWHDKVPEDCEEDFLEVTKILSDLLPKLEDPILFEVDDILCNQEYKGNESSKYDYDPKKLFEIPNISTYFRAYRSMVNYGNGVFVDNTVLRFIKHTKVYDHHLRSTLDLLLHTVNEQDVCRGLKIWKIILEGELKDKFLDREFYCTISSFKYIAEAKDPEYKRISKFISQLAGVCCNLVGEDNRYIFPEIGQSDKKAIIQGIHCLISNAAFPNYFLEFFYKTFSSIPEHDLDKKRKYLKYILRGITSCPMRVSVDTAITIIVDCLLDNIRDACSQHCNQKMILTDSRHGRNIKPYLEDVDFVVDPYEFFADEIDDESDETDYTFEKFFYYDKVMKHLHLLTIIYTALAECKNLCEGEFDSEDFTKAFRGNNALKGNLAFYLKNKELKVPWYVKKTMMMCPFLLFPLEHKDLVIDLIKLRRKEKLPNMSEELRKKVEELESFRSKLNDLRQERLKNKP